jgi:hypothetical protein
MAEGLKGVAGLIEVGTVAIQSGTDMSKMHLTIQDGRVRILILVEMKYIGMNEIDPLILHPRLSGWALPLVLLSIAVGTGIAHQ